MVKFFKECFVFGMGASVCLLGFHAGKFIVGVPIAKMTKKLDKLANDLERTAVKMEKELKQKKWREASEMRQEVQNEE